MCQYKRSPACNFNQAFYFPVRGNTFSRGNIWQMTQESVRCYSGIQLMCKGQGWWQHGPVMAWVVWFYFIGEICFPNKTHCQLLEVHDNGKITGQHVSKQCRKFNDGWVYIHGGEYTCQPVHQGRMRRHQECRKWFWAAEATLRKLPIPQEGESGNGCSWTFLNAWALFPSRWNF